MFSSNEVTLSTLISSNFGFFRITSSVGVSGDMGIAEIAVNVMPRSWSATAFRGLSPPEGTELCRGDGDAGRKAVFSSGIGGGWSRLRFGDGKASWVGGISPEEMLLSYMGAIVSRLSTGKWCQRDVGSDGNRMLPTNSMLRECGAGALARFRAEPSNCTLVDGASSQRTSRRAVLVGMYQPILTDSSSLSGICMHPAQTMR